MAQKQISEEYKNYCISEYKARPEKLKAWANQTDNLLLKELAANVISVAQGAKR